MFVHEMEEIYKENKHYHCNCGFVDSYQSHNRLMCLIIESDRIINSMRSAAEMSWSGQDMSYYINQLIKRKNEARENHMTGKSHMTGIREECSKQLEKIKEILYQKKSKSSSNYYNLFPDFIKQNPKYDNIFNMNNTEITFEEAKHIGQGTMFGEIIKFLRSDFVKEKIKKIDSEQNEKRRKEAIKNKEIQQKEEIKKKELQLLQDEEDLKKEYECMKLYNQVNIRKLNSYELYKEYSIIKLLHEQSSNIKSKFIDYFTDIKIKEIHEMLYNDGVYEYAPK